MRRVAMSQRWSLIAILVAASIAAAAPAGGLSVREVDRALDDLTRGSRLDSTNYGIWYHLGIVRYARGDFAGAADAFARAQRRPPDGSELAGATDWLWMSLSRAGRATEAQAM